MNRRLFSVSSRRVRAGVLILLCAALLGWGLNGCGQKGKQDAESQKKKSEQKQTLTNTDAETIETSANFVERTADSGVNFTYRNDEEAGHAAILESLGGGVGVIDFNNDGLWEFFIPGGGKYGEKETIAGRSPGLFRNLGDWKFEPVTAAAGVTNAPFYSHGAAVADYDNDGFEDVLVTGYGGVLLFHNMGDGTFEEVRLEAGLTDDSWSTSAAWADINRDGLLDLYIAHYVNWSFKNHPFCAGPNPDQKEVCSPRRYDPLPDIFYLNNGDGTFSDRTEEFGLAIKDDAKGKGLGVVAAQLNADADLDIDFYVANDTVPNFLHLNDGTGHFIEDAGPSGTSVNDMAVPDGSMGVDVGDFNLDGLPDLWVANFESESFALYRNEGDGIFLHVSQSTGVTAVGALYVGWGTVFFDFDLDADEDVFVSNGHVIRFPVNAPLRQKPLLFQNKNGEQFQDVTSQAGEYMTSPHMGRGVAVADFDGDGDQDLITSHTNEPVSLLENQSTADQHWISVRLIGTESNRTAIGTVVTLKTADGEQTRQVKGGTSYASTNAPNLVFGLGDVTNIESLTIRWPSGIEQTIPTPPVNGAITVVESK